MTVPIDKIFKKINEIPIDWAKVANQHFRYFKFCDSKLHSYMKGTGISYIDCEITNYMIAIAPNGGPYAITIKNTFFSSKDFLGYHIGIFNSYGNMLTKFKVMLFRNHQELLNLWILMEKKS